jgi:hypothetical protein
MPGAWCRTGDGMTGKKDYEVGYGKPPKSRRFKKGRSGNPKGRPKGATNKVSEDKVLTIFAREAYREVPVTEGNRTITLPIINVTLRNLMQKAAKGDFRSANLAIELLQLVEEKGASDKAIAEVNFIEAFQSGLDILSDEELRTVIPILRKMTASQLSPKPTRRARLAAPARPDPEGQSE